MNFSNVFYELDYKNERQCAETSDCMTGEEVLEIWIENAKLLLGTFKLQAINQSYIELPNLESNKINVSFLVLINNVSENQSIVSSKNGLWELKVSNMKFVCNIYSPNTMDNVELTTEIKSKKIYNILVNVENNDLIISIDNNINKLTLSPRECSTNNDCINGICVGNTKNIVIILWKHYVLENKQN